MKMDIRLWLITTDHLEDGLWFREEDDFKVGMNYIAVLAASLDIAILAFSLMSNHVHFVVLGTEADANEFINEFKRRYSKYYERKYGIPKFLKGNHVDIDLSSEQKKEVLRQLRYRFSSNIHQLSRIAGLDYNETAKLLDSQ